MRIKKTLFAGVVGTLGVSLLMMVISCGKSNPLTPANPPIITPSGTMTDIDGNVYHTVKIGDQVWTVENLRTTKFNDGTAITKITDNVAWAYNDTTPAFCYYNNMTNADSIKKWGALYNWYTVNTGKLAPTGWHVPTDSEWEVMQNYLVMHGYNYDGTTDTSTLNKIAMALAAKTDWYSDTLTGTIGKDLAKNNNSGFSALPGGFRHNNGSFNFIGLNSFWWSASVEYSASIAWFRSLNYVYDNLNRNGNYKSCGFSVRLIKDN